MPGSTGPDLNTFQIPEVQLGDTFNLWRDTTNTGIYKLNKVKVYDGVSSSSISMSVSTGGTLSAELADNINKGVTFNYGVGFSAGVSFNDAVVFQSGVTFNGNVTFNASTFTVNANIVTIDDYNLILGDTAAASDANISTAGGGGLLINRGSGNTASWLWNPSNTVGVTGVWSGNAHIGISGQTYGIIPHNSDILPVYGLRLGLEGGSTTDHGFEIAMTNSGVAGSTSNRTVQFLRTYPNGSTAFLEVFNGTTYGSYPFTSIPNGVNKKIVNQSSHGFIFGQPIYLNGSNYASAQANSVSKSEVVGLVSKYIDSNTFELTFIGEIYGDFSGVLETGSSLTPGSVYYLSPFTAGKLSPTNPIATGQVHKAVLIATGTNSAIVYPFTGGILASPISTVTASSLGVRYPQLNRFQVGDFVRWKPGSITITYGSTSGTYTEGIYVKAQADSSAEAEVAGMVVRTNDLDPNNPTGINESFDVLMDGFFSGLSLPAYYGQIDSGKVYFLNTNCAGTTGCLEGITTPFNSSFPVGAGKIRKPLFMCTTSDESQFSGYLFSYRGDQLDVGGLTASIPLESLLITNLGSCGSAEPLVFGVRDGNGTAGGIPVMRFPHTRPGSVEIGYTGTPGISGASLDVRGVLRGGRNATVNGGDIIVGRYNESGNNSSYPETLNVFGTQYSSGNSVISCGMRPKSGSVGYESTTGLPNIPRTALEVGYTTGGAGLILKTTSTTNSAIGTALSTTDTFYVTTSNMVYVGGNVGIGTTGPSEKLHVYGGSLRAERFDNGTSAILGGPSSNLQVKHYNGNANVTLYNSSGHGFVFSTWNGSETERARINLNGYLGIGTQDPNSLITVSGNSPVINIENTDGSGDSGAVLRFGHNQDSDRRPAAEIKTALQDGSATNRGAALIFAVSQYGSLKETMRIDRAGNVSIGSGTTAGAAGSLRYLDIHNQDNGTATTTGAIIRLVTRNSADTSTSIVDIVKYRNGAFYINNSDTNNSSVSTNFGLNGTNIMSISSTGASVSIAPTVGSNLANKTYVDGINRIGSTICLSMVYGTAYTSHWSGCTKPASSNTVTLPAGTWRGYAFSVPSGGTPVTATIIDSATTSVDVNFTAAAAGSYLFLSLTRTA